MSLALDVANTFIEALEAGDTEAAARLFHPNALVWHNFDNETQTVAQNMASLGWMVQRSRSLHYDLRRLEEIPDGYLQQHTLRVVMNDGETVQTEAIAVVTVTDGLITRIEEYIDPTPMTALAQQTPTATETRVPREAQSPKETS